MLTNDRRTGNCGLQQNYEPFKLLIVQLIKNTDLTSELPTEEIEITEKEVVETAPCLYGNEHVHPIFQNILHAFIKH